MSIELDDDAMTLLSQLSAQEERARGAVLSDAVRVYAHMRRQSEIDPGVLAAEQQRSSAASITKSDKAAKLKRLRAAKLCIECLDNATEGDYCFKCYTVKPLISIAGKISPLEKERVQILVKEELYPSQTAIVQAGVALVTQRVEGT